MPDLTSKCTLIGSELWAFLPARIQVSILILDRIISRYLTALRRQFGDNKVGMLHINGILAFVRHGSRNNILWSFVIPNILLSSQLSS